MNPLIFSCPLVISSRGRQQGAPAARRGKWIGQIAKVAGRGLDPARGAEGRRVGTAAAAPQPGCKSFLRTIADPGGAADLKPWASVCEPRRRSVVSTIQPMTRGDIHVTDPPPGTHFSSDTASATAKARGRQKKLPFLKKHLQPRSESGQRNIIHPSYRYGEADSMQVLCDSTHTQRCRQRKSTRALRSHRRRRAGRQQRTTLADRSKLHPLLPPVPPCI